MGTQISAELERQIRAMRAGWARDDDWIDAQLAAEMAPLLGLPMADPRDVPRSHWPDAWKMTPREYVAKARAQGYTVKLIKDAPVLKRYYKDAPDGQHRVDARLPPSGAPLTTFDLERINKHLGLSIWSPN